MTEATPWLKAMENGGLGEARAKAFLMDRFWVLERSVDIEGADYLVQRRLTRQNFMDRDPPRLGVVQVKFIQDGGTSISIHKSYVCDDKGSPFNEFFLLVFTGREDNEKSYLLSAKEIVGTFKEVVDGTRMLLRLSGAKLLASSNHEVAHKGQALDRIEHALRNADFLANRRFLGSTSYLEISRDHIDEDYLKPLENSYCDLQKEFFESKKKLQSALFNIEEVADAMRRILVSTDPIDAFRIYEGEIDQHVDGSGRLDLGRPRDIFDEDFIEAARNHTARLMRLRALGIEGTYFALLRECERSLLAQLTAPSFDSCIQTIQVTLAYDRETLRDPHVEICRAATSDTTTHVAVSTKGRQVAFFDLKRTLPRFAGTSSTDAVERENLVRDDLWRIRRPLVDAVDRVYLGEDL